MSLLVTLLVLLATTALLAWGVAAWVLSRAEALRLQTKRGSKSTFTQPIPQQRCSIRTFRYLMNCS